MPNVTITLSDQAHQLLKLRCAAEGISINKSVNKLVTDDLQSDFKLPVAKTRCPRREEGKQRVALMLTDSEVEAIDRLKNHIGGSRAGWIIEAIRTALTNEPSFTEDEIKALNLAVYELKKYAKAVNIWTADIRDRAMNMDESTINKVIISVDAMTALISKMCKENNRLICASRDRWSIK